MSDAISGEIVPADQWDEPRNGGQNGAGKRYSEEVIAEAIRARALGFSLRQISDRLGISAETVRKWCREAGVQRTYRDVDIPKVRAELAIELEAMQHEALRVVRMYPGTKLALEAITAANHVIRTRANLLGAVAPARVQVDVTETTAQDLELRDMINVAKAKQDAERARIRAEFEARQQ